MDAIIVCSGFDNRPNLPALQCVSALTDLSCAAKMHPYGLMDSERYIMIKWAIIAAVISVIAGFFGFSGVSAATAGIAKVLFGIAVVLFLIFVVLAILAGGAIL